MSRRVVIATGAVLILVVGLVWSHLTRSPSRGDATAPGEALRQFNHLVYTLGTPESMGRAERLLRAALETHPRKDLIYAHLGELEVQRADRAADVLGRIRPSPRARQWFQKALEIDPRNLMALRGMASYHEYLGEPRRAIAYDERIIKAYPRSSEARAHKGRSLLMLHRAAEAEKVLLEALRLAVEAGDVKAEVTSRELLGTAYTRQRKYRLAEAVLLTAVQQAEAKKVAACPYAALGELYHITGRKDKLVEVHVRAAEMESHKPKMQSLAARHCFEQGDNVRALKYIRRAIRLHADPRSLALQRKIVAALKLRSAAEELQQALTAFDRGNFVRAKNGARRALAAGGAGGRALVLQGFVALLERRYERAGQLLSSARKARPNDPCVGVGQGHLEIIRKDHAAAGKLLAAATAAPAASALQRRRYDWLCYRMAHLGMGWSAANTGRHEAAVRHFEAVLRHAGDDTFALLGKGNSLNAQGKLDAAERQLRRVLKLDPGNRFAMAELALVNFNRGRDAAAEKLFKSALAADPRRYTCPHEGLGMIYLRAGKLGKAKAAFRKAISINPNIEFKKFNGLARIYIGEGRHAEAEKLLRRSIQNYPHDDEARKLLAKIAGREGGKSAGVKP